MGSVILAIYRIADVTIRDRIQILSRRSLPLKCQKILLIKLTYSFVCTHKEVWPFLFDFHEMALYAHMFDFGATAPNGPFNS